MTKIETLDKETLKNINKRFSNEGIRSEAELDFIVYKTGSARGVNVKAATLLMETIRRHPFVDGNKRTAFDSMMVFLESNGKKLDVGDRSKITLAFWIVKPKTTLKEVVEWIANHTRW